MNWQEIFDICSDHLLTQNEKSEEYTGRCKYRVFREDRPPLKCAVGILIPDDAYDTRIEGTVTTLIDNIEYGCRGFEKLDKEIFNSDNEEILRKLQKVHDNFDTIEWKQYLVDIANRYKLEVKFDRGA